MTTVDPPRGLSEGENTAMGEEVEEVTEAVDQLALPPAPAVEPPPPPTFSFGSGESGGGFSFQLATAPEEDDDEDDDDDEGNSGAPLPREVLERVLGLKGVHEKRLAILKDYAAERCVLEKKFRELTEAVNAERAEIVAGRREPELSEEDKATVFKSGAVASEATGVPDFWLQALGHCEAFEHYLEECDIQVLKQLADVRCVDHDDMDGFTLEFEFNENEHFNDKVLTKKYKIPNLLDANGQPELEAIDGCDIDWKDPSDCLVARTVKKRQKARRGKHAGQTRVVSKLEPQPSFFRFFETIKLPTDDEEDDSVRDKIDNDVELAFALRNQVIPNAVLWFTGEAADDDDDDDEDDIALVDDDDDDPDDDDDDSDDA